MRLGWWMLYSTFGRSDRWSVVTQPPPTLAVQKKLLCSRH
jgi:hypothetical protein